MADSDDDSSQSDNAYTVYDEEAKRFTIGWICAIDTELAAAKAALDSGRQPTRKIKRPNDLNRYYEGKIGHHWVVVGWQHTMGQDAALELSNSMKQSFPCIQDFLVVGVAGGRPDYPISQEQQSIVLGDVVISAPWPGGAHIVRADHGTATADSFEISYKAMKEPSRRMKIALSSFWQKTAITRLGIPPWRLKSSHVTAVLKCAPKTEDFPTVIDPGPEKDYLIDLGHPHPRRGEACEQSCFEHSLERRKRNYRAERQENCPYVHRGPVASKLSFDADRARLIKSKEGFLCAEMEAASVAHEYPTLTIRGIMDYCDFHRAYMKEWKCYAAFTAAAAARFLISLIPEYSETEEPSLANLVSEKKPQKVSGTHHYLRDMPPRCNPYREQSHIRTALRRLCSVDTGGQTSKLLLYGLGGRGKTQACVAFMRDVREGSVGEWSHLLWVDASSPRHLFESLQRLQGTLEIPKSWKHDTDGSTTEQQAEWIASDVNTWLSSQDQRWLVVMDQLLHEDITRTGDALTSSAMEKMLNLLFTAQNGRIIATATRFLSQWFTREDALPVMAMSLESAAELVKDHFTNTTLALSEVRATHKLCGLLDYIPQAISFACSTIRGEKISIESYTKQWQGVFYEKPRGMMTNNAESRSLNVTMKLSYDSLKRQDAGGDKLRAIDLLHILVCLGGSEISEAIFRRCWESSSLNNWHFAENRHGGDAWSIWKQLGSFFQRLWTKQQSQLQETNRLQLQFLVRKPNETAWQGSAAQRQLRAALRVLEDFSLINFTDHPVDCNIKVSSIIQGWIRWRPYASGSLNSHDFRHAWRRASFILARSLRLGSIRESESEKSNFRSHAAAHIEQLRQVSDTLDYSEEFGGWSTSNSSQWTTHILSLPEASETTKVFGDALSHYGFLESAQQLRDAYAQSPGIVKNSIEELASRLVLAKSLEQTGKHRQALEWREAALQMLDSNGEDSSASNTNQISLLELMVQRDIADSLWHLGFKKKSSELLEFVLAELKKHQLLLEQNDSDYSYRDNSFRILLMEASVARVRCLVRYEQNCDEASAIMEQVLDYSSRRLNQNPYCRYLHLEALAWNAEIKSARGQYLDAYHERRAIFNLWQQEDPNLRLLNTMVAQGALAKSLSALGKHLESLEVWEQVDKQLSQPDCNVPKAHEFMTQSRQNMAICYMDLAEIFYDGQSRIYSAKGHRLVLLAVRATQWVLKTRQRSESEGTTHPNTLNALAILIRYERRAKSLGDRYRINFMASQELERTKIAVSSRLEAEQLHIASAWTSVLLEDCLVEDPVRRLKRLEDLRSRQDHLIKYSSEEVKLRISYETAEAHMIAPYESRGAERTRLKEDADVRAQIETATRSLEDVWKQRSKLLGPKSPITIETLISIIKAYEFMAHERYLELKMHLCVLVREIYGEKSDEATKELQHLNTARRARRQKVISWAELLANSQ